MVVDTLVEIVAVVRSSTGDSGGCKLSTCEVFFKSPIFRLVWLCMAAMVGSVRPFLSRAKRQSSLINRDEFLIGDLVKLSCIGPLPVQYLGLTSLIIERLIRCVVRMVRLHGASGRV